jgi:hypothetical protein
VALLETGRELNVIHYGMLPAPKQADIGGGYGSTPDRAMRNINAMATIGNLLGVMTDYSTSPKLMLPLRLFTAAKRRMASRLPKRTPTPPDNPPPDHTAPTVPRK